VAIHDAGNDRGNRRQRPARMRAVSLLIGVMAVVLAAGGLSTWVIIHFITQPEKTVILPPAAIATDSTEPPRAKFSGKVVDALTHQPIAAFAAQIAVERDDHSANYMNDAAQAFTNGTYAITSQYAAEWYPAWHVRVMARGYKPAESPTLSAGDSRDFELTAAPDLRGRVLDARGAPVTGATVALVLQCTHANINNGKLIDRGEFKTVTAADGRFDLPPPTDRFAIVAMSDAGYAQVNQDTLAKNGDVPLAAWGAIHGQAFIGTKPAAGVQVAVSSAEIRNVDDAWVINTLLAQTAQDGSFDFQRVPPGKVRVGRYVKQSGPYDSFYTDWASPQIAPGATAAVKLGGVGRPLTARLLLPPGLDWPHLISFQAQVAPSPQDQSLHYYMAKVDADHHLQIDNVVPGDYQITINTRPMRGQTPPPTTMSFTMPAVPGGVSDEPLDIGDVQVRGS
jgi:hypothetical protein